VPRTAGIRAGRRGGKPIKATVDFYVDVLGMPLVHAMKVPPGLGTGPGNRGNPPYERVGHYFFDTGNDSLLAFFEIPKGREPAGNRNAIGARTDFLWPACEDPAERSPTAGPKRLAAVLVAALLVRLGCRAARVGSSRPDALPPERAGVNQVYLHKLEHDASYRGVLPR
jgi:catechol 2,3-dioxygenase-like lactoylglutathione lyase family enzyme